MNVVGPLADLREARAAAPEPFGLVPTMGYLHDGHLSLVRRARTECESVGVSIFVNPTQFGPDEDLASYPTNLERDLELLAGEGADLVWTPDPEELYPPEFQTWVDVERLTQRLEGEYRPGHFRGVTTIVAKLFNSFEPDRAYFGQKDAQQARVIQQMVRDLNFPLEVIVCPTVRESDGLAMSSRNAYLGPEDRAAATVLYQALVAAAEAQPREAQEMRAVMEQHIAAEERAELQYVSVADPDTLQELEGPVDRALLSLAVHVGGTRLIDNLIVEDT